MELLQILLLALVPTIAIELGVLLFVRERRRKVLLASVVMNILTNIPLNFLMICLEGDDVVLFTAEAVVIVLEALGYMLVVRQWKQSFIYSFLCNSISFLSGLLVYMHRPDTADTILQVDSVKVQHMDLAPPPTAFESFLGGDVWTVVVVALALCACIYMAVRYRRYNK